jgi:hypothetical protein
VTARLPAGEQAESTIKAKPVIAQNPLTMQFAPQALPDRATRRSR